MKKVPKLVYGFPAVNGSPERALQGGGHVDVSESCWPSTPLWLVSFRP